MQCGVVHTAREWGNMGRMDEGARTLPHARAPLQKK